MKIRILVGTICLVFFSGCVTQKTFDALQKQFDEATAELTSANEKIVSLEDALAAEEAKLKKIKNQLKKTKAKLAKVKDSLAAQNKENGALQDELASVVKDRSKLKESAAKLKRALAELSAREAAAAARIAEFRALLAKFKTLIDAGKLKVRIVDGRMVLVLPTDILFDSGSAKLSEEGTQAIGEVAQILATMPDRKFQIEGHTDNVPINSKRYPSNWDLASARALGVVQAMIEAGMSGTELSAASLGEFRPVTTNDTPEGRSANRRIDIVLVPDLSALPGFKDLEKAVNR
jgi:chemotaxis protein MotB